MTKQLFTFEWQPTTDASRWYPDSRAYPTVKRATNAASRYAAAMQQNDLEIVTRVGELVVEGTGRVFRPL